MNVKLCDQQLSFLVSLLLIGNVFCAMTMKQLQKSMDMMRDVCSPKFQLTPDALQGLRNGVFLEDRELKCYTLCIAQMAGTFCQVRMCMVTLISHVERIGSKSHETMKVTNWWLQSASLEKTIKQLESMLPADVKQLAIDTVTACKDVQKQHKDPCDKTFYSAKCAYELQPEKFMFP